MKNFTLKFPVWFALLFALLLLMRSSPVLGIPIEISYVQGEGTYLVGVTTVSEYTIPSPKIEGKPYVEVTNYEPEMDSFCIIAYVTYDPALEMVIFSTLVDQSQVSYPSKEEYFYDSDWNLYNYVVTLGYTTNHVERTTYEIIPTPEPASIFVLGVGGLALVRKRRA